MSPKRTPIQTHHLRNSLLVLILFLMGISLARLLVTMHRQEERIEILEHTVDQLLADTTRLQLPPQSSYQAGSTNSTSSSQRLTPSRFSSPSRPSAVPVTSPRDTSAASTFTRSQKFTSPHTFDLNTIDSLTLIRIPGIASRTAETILRNRTRYGGFISPWQLKEFLTWDAAQAHMEEWCTLWFTADASRLRTLPINTASISQLQRHPYISHEQAVEIIRYRERNKQITSVTELQQLTTFTPEQLQQLLPYLSFE